MAQPPITLLKPTLDDRRRVYDWMTTPGIVERMMGPPLFSDVPVPTFTEFCADWPDPIWTHAEPEIGRMFIAADDGERVGAIAQNAFVVTGAGARAVELDLWLAGPDLIGSGYGRRMILAVCDVLAEFSIEEAFLQPSARNPVACRAYAGAGFTPSPLGFAEAAEHYRTRPDYRDSVFYVKRLRP